MRRKAINCVGAKTACKYRCGAKAANDLYAFSAQRVVACIPINFDRYHRTVASCSVDGVDLGHWLVGNGLALDWPAYSNGKYADAQKDAELHGRGMWAGSYANPWEFRACIRNGGRPAGCSDEPSLNSNSDGWTQSSSTRRRRPDSLKN